MSAPRPANAPSLPPANAAVRRVPAQQRSRDRLESILAAAASLIAAKGSNLMRMSEVAEQAGISIGSLYQYFPDKAAIVRTLAQRYSDASRAYIAETLAGVHDLAGLRSAYGSLIDQYYHLFLTKPVRRDIWSGMQADKDLMQIELAESRANGVLLAAVLARVHPGAEPERLAATAFMVWHLGEATMRLAVSLDRAEGDAVVEAFKRMTLREMSEP